MTHQCPRNGCGGCSKGCSKIPLERKIILFILTEGASELPVTGSTSTLAIQELAQGIRKLLESQTLLDLLAKKFGLHLQEVSGSARQILKKADETISSRSK